MGNAEAKLNANYCQKKKTKKCLKNFKIFGQEIKNYFPNCWLLIRVCKRPKRDMPTNTKINSRQKYCQTSSI